MKEIGGYFELENYSGQEYHAAAWALNSARGAMRIVLERRVYHKLYLPAFLCESVYQYCEKIGIELERYDIGIDFKPIFEREVNPGEAVYLVNYYGQLTDNEILAYKDRWTNIILDNVQAFFQKPLDCVDTIYSCRKFFGVPDGAYLAADLDVGQLDMDVSFVRMQHVLGRYEHHASEYYAESVKNNQLFAEMPPLAMSKLTHNMLRALDYSRIKQIREENFGYLHFHLASVNQLKLEMPPGPFAYPLLIPNGAAIRKELHKVGIYVPTLWPNVLQEQAEDSLAYRLAADILPLPCDQRYGFDDMKYLVCEVLSTLKGDVHVK